MRKSNKKINTAYTFEDSGGSVLLKLSSPIEIANARDYNKLTTNFEYLAKAKELNIDFSEVEKYDSYFVVFLQAIDNYCKKNNIAFTTQGISAEMNAFLDALKPATALEDKAYKESFWYNYFSHIGDSTKTVFKDTFLFVEFFGDLLKKIFILFIQPKQMRWKAFPTHYMKAGVHAVPITTLIVFLIGLITGYQGALQLSKFGADIFIADLIGISITREMAPLMVAILVAGRSGSAFAAEIGTMKVSEEIDALNSMGFDHIQFLVVPRVLSVVLAMPILILLTDLAGIAGGLLAAISTLDITIAGYVNELQRAISFWDVLTGIIKAVVFGFVISSIGCFRGLQVTGGAESVGKYTTASVVSSIFLIIVFDTLFTLIFQAIGI